MPLIYPVGFMTGSSSFDPSNAGTLFAWYRADQGTTIATGVSQWNDLSGNTKHLTQGTGANQPTLSSSGGPNSTATITFDGTNDALALTFSGVSQPFHTFMILKTLAVGTNTAGYIGGGASGERILTGNSGAASVFTYFGGTGITYTHTDTTNFFLWEVFDNAASSTVIRGNTAAGSGSIGTGTLSGISLGSIPSLGSANVSIAEVAMYNSQISGANLTSLRSYFATRYGVTTS